MNLLAFLDEEVAGETFPRNAFVYVCPIALDGFVPDSGMSFVRTKDQQVNVDVTPYIKFLVDFEELIWQGTYDDATSAERSKDMFPFVIQLNGVQRGFTNLRVIGLGQESYNAKPVQGGTQKVSANVQGNVVGDPDNGNVFKGSPVLADGHPVCTTKETFNRQ